MSSTFVVLFVSRGRACRLALSRSLPHATRIPVQSKTQISFETPTGATKEKRKWKWPSNPDNWGPKRRAVGRREAVAVGGSADPAINMENALEGTGESSQST